VSESRKESEDFGGVHMIKLSWRNESKGIEPRRMINPRLLELEAAKEILREVFHARPSDMEDMIYRRLEENNWHQESRQEEEKLWPASFGVSD
jgi:hypothetical protein